MEEHNIDWGAVLDHVKNRLLKALPFIIGFIFMGLIYIQIQNSKLAELPCAKISAIDQMLSPSGKDILVVGVDASARLCFYKGDSWVLVSNPPASGRPEELPASNASSTP